jgi:putative membrane protein
MHWGYGYYMAGMHVFWWLFWGVALAVILLALRGRSSASDQPRRETPREILDRSLASGEVAPDEYEQRLALLNKHL